MLDVKKFPLVSDQIEYAELAVIIRELERAVSDGVAGDVVELGCYEGTTSLFLQRVLGGTGRSLHVYDSFQGLPPKTAHDRSPAGNQFVAGELRASKTKLIRHFKHAGLDLPHIHTCWFEDVTTADMPSHIAFAFLDGDFYTSITASLRVITPLLTRGAIIVVDDYQSESLPGARRAVDEWAERHKRDIRTEQSLAIIRWE